MKFPVWSLVLVLVSCAPAPPAVPSSPAPNPKAAPASAPRDTGPRFDESLLRGKEFLLEAPASSAEVRDWDVGPWERGAAADVVQRLFRAWARGEAVDPWLVADWVPVLQTTLGERKASGDPEVRVGQPRDDWRPFVLRTGSQRLGGWILLEAHEGRYLVRDLIWTELKPRDRFDPEAEVQEISSPSRR